MRYTAILSALAIMAIGDAAAASVHHNHMTMHRRAQESPRALEKRTKHHIHGHELQRLQELGITGMGVNDCENNGKAWVGHDGPYTNTFHNDAGEHIMIVLWGPEGSWVNTNQPLITMGIAKGEKKTVSFANGISGAWAAVHGDTTLVNGQIADTWGEFTMSKYGVVDVSREVNMDGHHMTIHGPTCTTDMEQCVFVCNGGAKSCWESYALVNCDPAKQPGAQYGEYYGAPSGGCGGLGEGAHLHTIIKK